MTSREYEDAVLVLKETVEHAVELLIQNSPDLNHTAEIADLLFGYKTMFKQLLFAVALETGFVTVRQILLIARAILSNFSARSRKIRQLHRTQQTSKSQDEWMDIAEKIDAIQGNDLWRSDQTCPLYESDRINARVDELVHLMRRRDIFDLMFTLRGGIGRNKFGLMHEGLFSKAMAGSKVLVETYHNVVCAALEFVCDAPTLSGDDPIPTDARLAFFNETRHSYGRTAMMLSGGAALGFYHIGVVKALMENGLMPRVLSGASAGSIVCAMIATRTNEECVNDLFAVKGTSSPGHSGRLELDFFRPLGYIKPSNRTKKSDISKVLHNTAGAFQDVKRTWQGFTPIGLRQFTSKLYDIFTFKTRPKDILMNDTKHFRECCKACIGNFTFQEAFDRTGRILNITVSPLNRSDPPRLLNYLTAPHVLVWSAAVASSSLPGVFEANKLVVRDSDGSERYESSWGMSFQDGSMENDLPMQQLSEMFNINHFVISQANPHAIMFSSLGLNKGVWVGPVVGLANSILLFLKSQVKAWISNVVELISGRRVAPIWDTRRAFGSYLITQEYEGRECDITLNPWGGHLSLFEAFMHIIYNPSNADFREYINAAERETWRYIPAIKSHCAEEMTLDRCVQRLRKRLLAEAWENEHPGSSTEETTESKISQRVPSFFKSPSLVNFGGLAVGDQLNLPKWEHNGMVRNEGGIASGESTPVTSHQIEFNPGWAGMGLHGNHRKGSMASFGSGLFLIDDEEPVDEDVLGRPWKPVEESTNGPKEPEENYFKTTNMASFYYRRRSKSHSNLLKAETEALNGSGDGSKSNAQSAKKQHKSSLDLSEHGKRKILDPNRFVPSL